MGLPPPKFFRLKVKNTHFCQNSSQHAFFSQNLQKCLETALLAALFNILYHMN